MAEESGEAQLSVWNSELMCHELERPDGSLVAIDECLSGVESVYLYFSASWCPPCQATTPKLNAACKAAVAAGKSAALIFVSLDQQLSASREYRRKMDGMLALPDSGMTNAQAIASKHGITSIPCVIKCDGLTGGVVEVDTLRHAEWF